MGSVVFLTCPSCVSIDIALILAKLDLSHLTNVHTVETPAATSPMPKDEDSQGNKENVTAFDRLVLEKGHQSMIVSLIAQHFRDKRSATGHIEETDIVKGKGNVFYIALKYRRNGRLTVITGKGLILLLHGAPGVGKTSTAGPYSQPPYLP
jgi:hypothetical protein